MTGFINHAEAIHIAPKFISLVRLGDIVLFFDGEYLVCHRVIRKQTINGNTTLITKGDWMIDSDPPVTKQNFIGVVVAIERPYGLVDLMSRRWRLINLMVGCYMFIVHLATRTFLSLLRRYLVGEVN
ncbi:MAG: hypothetical protein AB1345_09410 [Chloroflexota bacterium]